MRIFTGIGNDCYKIPEICEIFANVSDVFNECVSDDVKDVTQDVADIVGLPFSATIIL